MKKHSRVNKLSCLYTLGHTFITPVRSKNLVLCSLSLIYCFWRNLHVINIKKWWLHAHEDHTRFRRKLIEFWFVLDQRGEICSKLVVGSLSKLMLITFFFCLNIFYLINQRIGKKFLQLPSSPPYWLLAIKFRTIESNIRFCLLKKSLS